MANSPRNRSVSEQSEEARGALPRTSFKFRGHTYHLPHQDNWSIEALVYMAESEENPAKAVLFVRDLLGPQWKAFVDRNKTAKALGEFMEVAMRTVTSEDDTPN